MFSAGWVCVKIKSSHSSVCLFDTVGNLPKLLVSMMSIENARLVYPLLVRIARELAAAARERRPVPWVTYDEFCLRCQELGMKETPRTIMARVLRPLQNSCIENSQPDLASLVIMKPKSRSDSGVLIKPAEIWWEPYVTKGETETGNIDFWFGRYKQARDHEAWPETPFF